MTNKTLEALALAEVALMDVFDYDNVKQALDAIREAKAELEKQEPVAWMHKCGGVCSAYDKEHMFGLDYFNIPLYAAPVQQAEPVAANCPKCKSAISHWSWCPDFVQPVSQKQEPVAWALSHSLGVEFSSKYPMQTTKEAAEQMAREHMGNVVVTPLYAAPVSIAKQSETDSSSSLMRTTVRTKDLTDDEIDAIPEFQYKPSYDAMSSKEWFRHMARAVIAKFKEKNK